MNVFKDHVDIIHISRQYMSFLILVGQNSVAEWQIVVSINNIKSDLEWPINLSLQVGLWHQSVIYTQCVYLCLLSLPRFRFMISLIFGEWLWINTFVGIFLFSGTRNICNGVDWELESETGPVYGCFIQRMCYDQSNTWGRNWNSIHSNSWVESMFSPDSICSGYRNDTNSHRHE